MEISPWVLLLLAFLSMFSPSDADPKLQTYIFRIRVPENVTSAAAGVGALENWYRSLLPPTAANSTVDRLRYAYRDVFTGFAARLSEEELQSVAQKEGFLAVYKDYRVPVLTTHTPRFLGLQLGRGLWSGSNMGRGVVIGILDTGFTPGHPSYSDEGMEPPPSRWKGDCGGLSVGCNRKVIGAKAFLSDLDDPVTPVDANGHGTHTSTAAAGNFVNNASLLGTANGTASGVAPRAHLSVYRVCAQVGCAGSDVIAGMDAAVRDGVDVLSLSLGAEPSDFVNDVIAIGAFGAMEKGVFISCAGGNSGPEPQSVTNGAPWVLTVGASTTDRNLRATVELGNGVQLNGETAYQPSNFRSAMLPLVFPGSKGNGIQYCLWDSDMVDVKGKIAVCRYDGNGVALGQKVKSSGGKGLLIVNNQVSGFITFAEPHWLPAAHLNYLNGTAIEQYASVTKKPVGSITFKGTVLGVSPSPVISFFSSRGPNSPSQNILKPDVIGPGVNILSAWPTSVGPPPPAGGGSNASASTFNIISGTSMSTPHLSGVAALIKAAHPDWSPAAIKSAIMTTADIMDSEAEPIKDEHYQPASFFDKGTGHVNPRKAADPGLVYDIDADEYVGYLCGMAGYTDREVEIITNRKAACAKVKKMKAMELNYPAIVISTRNLPVNQMKVSRRVRYVGEGKSTFEVKVDGLKGVEVEVSPEIMEFSGENEMKTFTVSFAWKRVGSNTVEGNLRWVSEKHSARIPVIVTTSD